MRTHTFDSTVVMKDDKGEVVKKYTLTIEIQWTSTGGVGYGGRLQEAVPGGVPEREEQRGAAPRVRADGPDQTGAQAEVHEGHADVRLLDQVDEGHARDGHADGEGRALHRHQERQDRGGQDVLHLRDVGGAPRRSSPLHPEAAEGVVRAAQDRRTPEAARADQAGAVREGGGLPEARGGAAQEGNREEDAPAHQGGLQHPLRGTRGEPSLR